MNIMYRARIRPPFVLLLLFLLVKFAATPMLHGQNTRSKRSSLPPVTVMEVNEAVMVTLEEDFGKPTPRIADALKLIDRRYKPSDGKGRTFAILDAYGEAMPDGRLHISMHVSSEKPGSGLLVHRKSGRILWRGSFKPAKDGNTRFNRKNLTILMDNGEGKTFTIDGSSNPSSILMATIRELNRPVHEIWKDGSQREFTFIYSACGCPVKVMVKRSGNKTVRTSELPVIFPDDPVVVSLITRLMRW